MSGPGEMPTIRFELNGIRESIIHAFIDRQEEIKLYTVSAIDNAMNTLAQGGLERVIVKMVIETVENTLPAIVKESVEESIEDYFSNGKGKEFVIKAIQESMK